MEISTREKTLQIVSRYVIITLSISIMTIGVYFFKFPNNFVFGGVTGGAALVAKLTPLSASAFSSGANILSLIHISEPTRRTPISYAVFCLKKKKRKKQQNK